MTADAPVPPAEARAALQAAENRLRCCAKWECSALYVRSLPECPKCGTPASKGSDDDR